MAVLFTIPPDKKKHKDPVSIYVRLSQTKEFQLFSNTGFKVHPKYWNFDSTKKERLKKNFKAVPRTKKEVEQRVKVLSETFLNELKTEIEHKFEIALLNRDKYPKIKSPWLKAVVREFRKEKPKADGKDPDVFVNFFDDYIERKDMTKFNPILRRVQEFQIVQSKEYDIKEIDSDFSLTYSKWLKGNNFTLGYIKQELSHIKRVVKDAKKKGFDISELDLNDWVKINDKEKKTLDVVYLDWDEIERVYNCDVSDSPMLDNMKTILLTSCYTGLRFSDAHKVVLKKVKDNKITIQIKKKGEDPHTTFVHPRVIELLKKNPIKKISNTHFNDHIGTLIKKAGIKGMVKSRKRERDKTDDDATHRIAITKKRPKYEVVSSHCGRRSFCSNYYYQVPTPILMEMSHHETSGAFLRYIGKTSDDAANVFMDILKRDGDM